MVVTGALISATLTGAASCCSATISLAWLLSGTCAPPSLLLSVDRFLGSKALALDGLVLFAATFSGESFAFMGFGGFC